MKRIATAAVAATLSLTAVASPAIAQETTGSSAKYQECKTDADAVFANAEKIKSDAKTETGKGAVEDYKALKFGENNSSTATGVCIKQMVNDEDTKAGTLAVLIGVPVALVALLGVAAAYAGVIPGVELPALPF